MIVDKYDTPQVELEPLYEAESTATVGELSAEVAQEMEDTVMETDEHTPKASTAKSPLRFTLERTHDLKGLFAGTSSSAPSQREVVGINDSTKGNFSNFNSKSSNTRVSTNKLTAWTLLKPEFVDRVAAKILSAYRTL